MKCSNSNEGEIITDCTSHLEISKIYVFVFLDGFCSIYRFFKNHSQLTVAYLQLFLLAAAPVKQKCQKINKMLFMLLQAPINFSNSEFYGFSEFFYCMEDVLRIGGQYDSEKYSRVAKVTTNTPLIHIHIYIYSLGYNNWVEN